MNRQLLWIAIAVSLTIAASPVMKAQLRYEHGLTLSAGAYSASGFGTNQFVGARYNYFLFGGKYFVEASYGTGSLKSKVLENLKKPLVYDTERLVAYEFLAAYDHNPSGYLPYFAAGVAGIDQGGVSRFAGVVGVGKRIPLIGFLGTDQFGVRYDIRDHIFSQTISDGEPFISHNLVFTFGLQLYL